MRWWARAVGVPEVHSHAVNGHATFRNISVTIAGFPWGNIVESGEDRHTALTHNGR